MMREGSGGIAWIFVQAWSTCTPTSLTMSRKGRVFNHPHVPDRYPNIRVQVERDCVDLDELFNLVRIICSVYCQSLGSLSTDGATRGTLLLLQGYGS